jgi:hypothetical protein
VRPQLWGVRDVSGTFCPECVRTSQPKCPQRRLQMVCTPEQPERKRPFDVRFRREDATLCVSVPVNAGPKLDTKRGQLLTLRSRLQAFYLQFRSLRGLDLNQRPLGYEFERSRSAEAYPLLIGHVRSAEIT